MSIHPAHGLDNPCAVMSAYVLAARDVRGGMKGKRVMIAPEYYQPRLRKARALATELRNVLEELELDMRDGEYDEWTNELEELTVKANDIEGFLDECDLGDK